MRIRRLAGILLLFLLLPFVVWRIKRILAAYHLQQAHAAIGYLASSVVAEFPEDAIVRELETVLRYNPNCLDAIFLLSDRYMAMGKLDAARALLLRLSALCLDYLTLSNQWARLEMRSGHLDEAERRYLESIRKFPRLAPLHLSYANNVLMAQGRYQTALRYLDNAYRYGASMLVLHQVTEDLYYRAHDPVAGVTQAILLFQKDPTAWTRLTPERQKMTRMQAVKLDRQRAGADRLRFLEYAAGRVEKILADEEPLQAMKSCCLVAKYLGGDVSAMDALIRMCKKFPRDMTVRFCMGYVLAHAGEIEQALLHFKQAVLCSAHAGDRAKAALFLREDEVDYRQPFAAPSIHAWSSLLTAFLLASRGDEDALAFYRKALALLDSKQFGHAHASVEIAYAGRTEPALAKEYIQHFQQLFPRHGGEVSQ